MSVVRDAAAVGAAAGVVLLLAPLGERFRPVPRRAAGLVVLVASWLVLAGTLAPDGALDRLRTPAGAVAGLAGLLVAAGATILLVRLILRRPWVWFLLLAVALPVRVPVSVGGEDANLLLPLYAVIGLGVIAWVWGRARGAIGDRDPCTPLDGPLGAFVAFTLVSILWSSDTDEGAVKAVFFYLPFVLLYLLVVAWWPRGRALLTLAITTMAMAVPVAILAMAQYATREVFWNERLQQSNVYSRFFRANGIFYDPNILGRYLVLAILAAVAVAWLARRPRDLLLCGVVAAVCAGGLAVTFSRSSTLMLLVGLVMLAWRAYGWRRTLAVTAALLVVGVGLAVASSSNVRRVLTSAERLDRVSEGRFDLVGGGVDIWTTSPVVGTGLGSFAVEYEDTLDERDRRRTRVIISHNAPVTVLTELGAIGFALLVVLCGWTTLAVWRVSRSPDPDGWAAWVMLAGLVGILVHSLLYSALFEDPYTWVLAAGAMGIGALAAVRGPAPARVESEPGPPPASLTAPAT